MEKLKSLLWFGTFITLMIFGSCKKDAGIELSNSDSKTLCQALIDADEPVVKSLIDDLAADLEANARGHADTFDTLIERLNSADCLEANMACFECGLSMPSFSLVDVTVDFDGQQVERTLTITGVPNNGIEFWRME